MKEAPTALRKARQAVLVCIQRFAAARIDGFVSIKAETRGGGGSVGWRSRRLKGEGPAP